MFKFSENSFSAHSKFSGGVRNLKWEGFARNFKGSNDGKNQNFLGILVQGGPGVPEVSG